MTHGFTNKERDYLWDNSKGFFFLFLTEGALLLACLVLLRYTHPLWPILGFIAICAVSGGTFCLYNIHVRQLALNIFNQRRSRKQSPP